MIKSLRKKFILVAFFSVFVLLTLILGIINIVNFEKVGNDADIITEMIRHNNGGFNNVDPNYPNGPMNGGPNNNQTVSMDAPPTPPNGMDGYGPDSPELTQSTRYFTVSFDLDNVATIVEFKISAVTEEEGVDWASSLIGKDVGWTKFYYRYRVWTDELNHITYVTIIDQSRELLPSYRVLITSIIGGIVGLILTLIVLIPISKKFVEPIEKRNREQRSFVASASLALKNPITSIDTSNKILELKNGDSEEIQTIDRSTSKLIEIARGLDDLTRYDNEEIIYKEFNLSNLAIEISERYKELYKEKAIEFVLNINENINYSGDFDAFGKLFNILLDNGLKYTLTTFKLELLKENERIIINTVNDALNLEDGDLDSALESFYRSDEVRNSGIDGVGLGLSVVKSIVDKHKGRIIVRGEAGNFILKIEL